MAGIRYKADVPLAQQRKGLFGRDHVRVKRRRSSKTG
jgi:hypothetical protein